MYQGGNPFLKLNANGTHTVSQRRKTCYRNDFKNTVVVVLNKEHFYSKKNNIHFLPGNTQMLTETLTLLFEITIAENNRITTEKGAISFRLLE